MKTTRRNGFLILDAMMGTAILALLATLLVVAVNLRYRNAKQLSDQRIARAEAQRALASLQSGLAVPNSDSLSVRRTGQTIGGMDWVEVNVIHEGRRISLLGPVPSTQPGGAR